MSEEERLELENELLTTCSKAEAINKYIDELEENYKLSELWCKSQQENKQLKDKINTYENPEDLTLMFMYCDEKAKDKIKGLKEVIDEAREYVNNHIHQETFTGYMDSYELKKLLQILDKVGD